VTSANAVTPGPRDLIPGDPVAVQATAAGLRRYGDALHQAGQGLARIDTGDGWSGDAGDAFRARFSGQPQAWLRAGDCFHAAADALDTYAAVLASGQQRAGAAQAQWQDALSTSQRAWQAHQQDEQRTGQALPFNDPGQAARQAAQATLDAARSDVGAAGDAAAEAVGRARDQAPERPGFWDAVGDFLGDVGGELANVGAGLVNGLASVGNAMIHHPEDVLSMLGGAGLMTLGAGGEVLGVGLDATGIGAVAGVPANVASAGVITAGAGLTAVGTGDLTMHAMSDDSVSPLQGDYGPTTQAGYEPTSGYHGSEFSQGEIEQFVNGHTGDANPVLTRPSEDQVHQVLDTAVGRRLSGQNAEEFVRVVNGEEVHVIVNYDLPWRSTAFVPEP
jgi:uncharacterized protein YukE